MSEPCCSSQIFCIRTSQWLRNHYGVSVPGYFIQYIWFMKLYCGRFFYDFSKEKLFLRQTHLHAVRLIVARLWSPNYVTEIVEYMMGEVLWPVCEIQWIAVTMVISFVISRGRSSRFLRNIGCQLWYWSCHKSQDHNTGKPCNPFFGIFTEKDAVSKTICKHVFNRTNA